MFQTRLTDLLGIKYPIIGGCMQYISGPEFTASICNAGALGIMSSAMFRSRGKFRDALLELKSLTDRPYAINLNLFPALRPVDNQVYLDIILEEDVPAVEFSGNRPPEDILACLKEAGVKVLHKCVSIRHALSAQNLGVSAVALLGSEGGGHIGEEGLTALSLIPHACDTLYIPVIAAGGIVDGRTFLAAMDLGAEGVQVGTRFLVTEECPIHANIKSALVAATGADTMRILGVVHNQLRVLKNGAALKVQELEANKADVQEIFNVAAGANVKRLLEDGDIDAGVLACGQNIGIIDEIEPVSRVIEKMVMEAEEIIMRHPLAGRAI